MKAQSPALSSNYLKDVMVSQGTSVFDLEADGFLDTATKVHCLAWSEGGDGPVRVTRDTKAAVAELARADVLVGHNIIRYDIPLLEKLGFPCRYTGVRLIDTMLLAQLSYPNLFQLDAIRKNLPKNMWGRHSLKAWGMRLGVLKDDYSGGFEEWNQEMQDYNVQDVTVTQCLLEHLSGRELPEDAVTLEMEFAEMIASQERTGVLFDEKGAMALYAKLETIRLKRLDEMQATFPPIPTECLGIYGNQVARAARLLEGWGLDPTKWEDCRERLEAEGIKFKWSKEVEFNPSSNQHIADRMMKLGWIPTQFTETGQPQVDEPVVLAMGRQFPEAQPLADYLLVTKRMGQIANPKTKNGWLDRLADDGRVHGRVDTLGCVSFRCAHKQPNLGQVPACGKPYGRECRSLFMVPEGRALVGCDASGLELRFLGHYMSPWDGGAFAEAAAFGRKENGTDIHTVNQKAAGLPTRDNAKTFIYALIYGAGDAKLGQIVKPNCQDRHELIRIGKRLRNRFMKATPALKLLGDAVRQKATKQKKLIGLDGRVLTPRSAHSALNLLLQSAGAIAVKKSTVLFRALMEEAGFVMEAQWWMVLHVHDEWQTECDQGIADDTARLALRSIETAGHELRLTVPLAGEAQIGRTWADTH